VSQFKYLGTTVTNQDLNQEEIKRGLRRRGGRGWWAGGGVGSCWGPTSGRGASVCRLLVAACVVPGSPVLFALVGGGGAFLRGVGSFAGAARRGIRRTQFFFVTFRFLLPFLFSVLYFVWYLYLMCRLCVFDVYVLCI
jgi:hypothetical protein